MPAELVDLSRSRRIHVVGIGGAGMSGLARILVGLGHTVTGSDLAASSTVVALRDEHLAVILGHDASNLGDADLVTASPAVPQDNVELTTARARGVEVASRAAMLAAVCTRRATLAVTGTHGKTTTSSMLALILSDAGRSPSWLLGADVAGLGSNARLDAGTELVVEADESYGAFAQLAPELVALTNVEADHLDHYGSEDVLREAFAALLSRSTARVVNADDATAAALGAEIGALRVGTGVDDEFCVSEVHLERATSRFRLRHPSGTIELTVGTPGRHNVTNAALAAAVALTRGVDSAHVTTALGRFGGVPRRFEFRGQACGADVVDDYAHLPAEVAAAVAAARVGRWPRIVAVFQPHRFTRTAAVADGFGHAFDGADLVVVTDVYAAGEQPIPGVTGRVVAESVERAAGGPEVRYVRDRARVAEVVASLLEPGDLVLTMGAGDLTSLADELRSLAQ